MQRLEVSCAVRRIYIYIYVVRRRRVNFTVFEFPHNGAAEDSVLLGCQMSLCVVG